MTPKVSRVSLICRGFEWVCARFLSEFLRRHQPDRASFLLEKPSIVRHAWNVNPNHSSAKKLRLMAVRASLAVAILLLGLKWLGVILTGSTALLATLIDSGLDLLASAMAMLGVITAARPADHDHGYGHGKAESISALLQGGLIIGSAGMLTVEAVEHLFTPTPVQEPLLASVSLRSPLS